MNYLYRVYGWKYEGGIDLIVVTPHKSQAIITGRNLNRDEYIQYLIIEHDIERDSDFPIIREPLYKGRVLKRSGNNV